MRVIFLADSISEQKAGIRAYGLQLVNRVISEYPNHQYSLISSRMIAELDVKQHVIPINRSIPMHLRWRQFTSIPKMVNRLKPDVVIELAHFGPFRLDDNIQRITVIHDLTPIILPQYHGWSSHWAHKILLPWVIKQADKIITNSQRTKADIGRQYSIKTKKIQVVYPKLLSKRLTPSDLDPQPYFLAIGTLEPRKNYEMLINAFDQFCTHSDNNMQLVIIGAHGWKNDSLMKQIAKSPFRERIKLTGYISDKEKDNYLRHAWAYINSSHYEGFGMPLLEAMNHGLPMILSNQSCFPEVANEAAIYVNNSSELSTAMKSILNISRREQLSRASEIRARYYENQTLKVDILE